MALVAPQGLNTGPTPQYSGCTHRYYKYESDLKSVLLALKKIYTDFVKDETPMELVDMHIENLDFTVESSEEVKSAHLTAA